MNTSDKPIIYSGDLNVVHTLMTYVPTLIIHYKKVYFQVLYQKKDKDLKIFI